MSVPLLGNIALLGTPAPPSGAPNIPAGLVVVGARIDPGDALMLNPASNVWDVGAGGTPVFGFTNGSIPTAPGNSVLGGDGFMHIKTNGSTGAWITSMPKGLTGNGRSGGAAVGLALPAAPAKYVLEVSMKIGGSAPDTCWAWAGPFTQSRQTTGASNGGPNYTEGDVFEPAGWPGGDRKGTASYHWAGGGPNPNAIEPTFTPADGDFHTYDFVVGGGQGSPGWYVWDGAIVAAFTIQKSLQDVINLASGFTAGNPQPSDWDDADVVIQWIRAWAAS